MPSIIILCFANLKIYRAAIESIIIYRMNTGISYFNLRIICAIVRKIFELCQ